MPVCQAIQHAHQKGIIHRDIKPSNVLVTLDDDRPVPKVIDFGVAKATEPQFTEQSLLTGFGALVGTPEYMSPEQAGLNNLDIDTRSDVYALGAVLYELLTGTTPVDRDSLGETALMEVLRIVREVEPRRPSAKLSTLDDLPSVAAHRATEPARLAPLVQGELDWIVMKALEKDRTRRYETANALARDIQRYLADEMVEARPPSAAYRLRKFARRHPVQVVAASAVLVALLAGVIGTSWGLVRAEKAYRAEEQRAEGERLAKIEAVAERHKAQDVALAERTAREREEKARKFAQAISDFVRNDLLAITSVEGRFRPGSGEQDRGLGNDATVRQLLDRAAGKLSQRRDLDPRIAAELNWIVGVSYRATGEAKRALPYLERCVALRQAALGPDAELTLIAQNSLAVAYHAAGDLQKAIPIYEQTLARNKVLLGPNHRHTLSGTSNLARAYQASGHVEKALPLLEETLRLRTTALGRDHPDTVASSNDLALGYRKAGQLAKALPLLEASVRNNKAKLGPDDPATLVSMNILAEAYQTVRQFTKALPLYEETVRIKMAKLGPDHPDTLRSKSDLASAFLEAGHVSEALPLCEEALAASTAKLGRDHPETLTTMNNLALGYRSVGQRDKALPLYDEAFRLTKAKLGPEDALTIKAATNLASVLLDTRQPEKALPLLVETLRIQEAKVGPDDPDTLVNMSNLATGYWQAGRLDQSIPLFEDALRRLEKKLGRSHTRTLSTAANLGVNYKDAGRLQEALPLLEEAHRASQTTPTLRWVSDPLLDAYVKAGRFSDAVALTKDMLADARKRLPQDSPQLAAELASIGSALVQARAFTDAEPLLRECLAIREKTGPDAWTTFNTQSLLGGSLLGQKKLAEAEPLLQQGYEGMKAREKTMPPQAAMRIPDALDRLIDLYRATGKPSQVKKWQAERAKYHADAKPERGALDTRP